MEDFCARSLWHRWPPLELLESLAPAGHPWLVSPGASLSGFAHSGASGVHRRCSPELVPWLVPPLLVRQQDLFGRATCWARLASLQGIAGALACAEFPVSFRCPACGPATPESYPCWASR